MYGDLSRDSFQPDKDFLRVLMLQGRPLLEADFNEQTAILLRRQQTLATDLFGPYAAFTPDSFRVEHHPQDVTKLLIHPGAMYVGGLRVENDGDVDEAGNVQPIERTFTREQLEAGLVYLDVFERVVFPAEDSSYIEPALRNTVLTLRTQLTWQVKIESALPAGVAAPQTREEARDNWAAWVALWQPDPPAKLNVKLNSIQGKATAPCAIPADAAYRGLYNQLYRVEIHSISPRPTFKWSRENGAVVVAVQSDGLLLTPNNLRAVDWSYWTKDTWVEMLTAENLQTGDPGTLTQITDSRQREGYIGVQTPPDPAVVMLRRWDMNYNAAVRNRLKKADDNAAVLDEDKSLPLENGIEITFEAGGTYRVGDYWMIPARTESDDLIWSKDQAGNYVFQPPHGVIHYYAPLLMLVNGQPFDLRYVLVKDRLF